MFRQSIRIALALVALAPAAASADWLFLPSAGLTFGGDLLGGTQRPFSMGVGWLDEDAFGVEAEVGYVPHFFDGGAFSGSGSALSLMGNVIVGVPSTPRILPYVTGGAGWMRMQVSSDGGAFRSSTHEPGFNLGAGLAGFVNRAVGIRGDLRYFRSFRDLPPSWTRGVDIDIAPGHFDFWRATLGVVIRVRE